MRLLIVLLFSIFFSSQNGNAQVSTFHFTDGLTNNILFFEKVNDSIICVRNTNQGIQWNVLDTALHLANSKLITAPVPPSLFRNQLKPLRNSLVFISQRLNKDRFEVALSKIPLGGTDYFSAENIVFSENSTTGTGKAFSFSSSPDKSRILFVRTEKTLAKDSLLFKLITLDDQFNLLTQQDIFIPLKQVTEMLMGILIDNDGDVTLITGHRFDSYVLGTELNITVLESSTGLTKSRIVKVPRSKLKNIIINNQQTPLLQLYASYSDNADHLIDGVLNVSINKKNFANTITTYEFDRDEKKELGKILSAAPKSVLDDFYWHTSDISENNQWLTASVRNAAKFPSDFIQRVVPGGKPTANTAVNGSTASGNQTSNSTSRRTSIAGSADQVLASAYARPLESVLTLARFGDDSLLSLRRNYREALLLINKTPENAINVNRMYDKFIYTGSVFPTHCFQSSEGGKLLYSIKRKEQYELATSVLKDGKLSSPQIIDQTKNIMIDEYVPPIYLKNKIVFAYKNIRTGHSGLIAAQ
jgi:hypothetical protein